METKLYNERHTKSVLDAERQIVFKKVNDQRIAALADGKDGLAKDAKILAIAERSALAQETATAAIVELRKTNDEMRKTNDLILRAVQSCPHHAPTDHAAALRQTQRMDPIR
jgi:hypothetical protein